MKLEERQAKETAREYAYRMLRKNIIELELEPGSLVSESELASEIGLSRTPVREAMQELSKYGIVEIYPQKGTYIEKIDYDKIEEARFIRLVLEKAVLELLCESRTEEDIRKLQENIHMQKFFLEKEMADKLMEQDNEFHRLLFEMSKKTQAYYILGGISTHFDRVRSMSLKSVKNTRIVSDHERILEAIKNRDSKEAANIITEHLSRHIIDQQTLKQKYPGYFMKVPSSA